MSAARQSLSRLESKSKLSVVEEKSGHKHHITNSSRDPALAHIMKQINALKCENLELKKMIASKRGSSPHFSAHKSNKKVSISDNYDGRSGRSKTSILKSSVGSRSRSGPSRNYSRNTK